MKIIYALLAAAVLCAVAVSGCVTNSAPDPIFSTLNGATGGISDRLNATEAAMHAAAAYTAAENLSPEGQKQALASLYQTAPLAHDILTADAAGIVTAVYPDNIHSILGRNLSQYPPDAETFAHADVYVSEYLTAENGQKVYLMSVPVRMNGTYAGYISLSFDPFRLFGQEESAMKGTRYSLFVLQTDGVQVYDPDVRELGQNVLFDAEYDGVRGFVTAVCSNPKGVERYSYYANGGTDMVNKTAVWDTVSFGSRDWRVAVTVEEQ
ncbi:MAG: hypothetical protein Q4Q04_03915 [Methanocorpusculum sp.]|nr:hypothetical protein [Methanocorpusculum sp.]